MHVGGGRPARIFSLCAQLLPVVSCSSGCQWGESWVGGLKITKGGLGFLFLVGGRTISGRLGCRAARAFGGFTSGSQHFFFFWGGSLAAGPNAPCNFGILPKGVEIWLLGRRLGARRRSNHFWDFLEIFLIPKSLKPLASSCGNSYISFWW